MLNPLLTRPRDDDICRTIEKRKNNIIGRIKRKNQLQTNFKKG